MARAISKMIGHSPRLDVRPPAREFPVAPRRMLYLCGLVAGCTTAMPGLALTLGGVTEQSQLGQPFRMVVPVVTQATEELSGECVKLVPSRTKNGDDIPEVAWANVAVEQVGPSTRLVVSSRRPVNDPVIRVTLQAGCEQETRREYVMLLDPPVVDAPLAEANADASAGPSAGASAPPDIAATLPVTFPAQVEPVSLADNASRTTVTTRTRSVEGKTAVRTNAPKPLLTTNDRPRLAVSRAIPEPDASRPEGFARMSKSAQLAAVEEQEVVLRKRVEELTGLVERMQQERIALLSAEVERLEAELRASDAARRVAESAARTSPWPTIARWNGENWPLLVGALVIAGLLAGGVVWWRRGFPSRTLIGGERPLMASAQSEFEAETYMDGSLAVDPTPAPSYVIRQPLSVRAASVGVEPLRPTEDYGDFDRELAEQTGSLRRLANG